MLGPFFSLIIPEEKEGCCLYYSRRRLMVDLPEEMTTIWSCANKKCNGWMRDNFVFLIQPICGQCNSFMEKSERMLPILANTSPNQTKH
ncbi:cold-shock protein [Paenibacillus ihbetae]|uniref:cold-shock protein n=1 Tax=Paenibacillus ihbetae TaxID=1870820 RepID=UPI0026818F7F|nr:cold-shock protein [Paenibacillus ihbetae]